MTLSRMNREETIELLNRELRDLGDKVCFTIIWDPTTQEIHTIHMLPTGIPVSASTFKEAVIFGINMTLKKIFSQDLPFGKSPPPDLIN